jgi:hypothetical protein
LRDNAFRAKPPDAEPSVALIIDVRESRDDWRCRPALKDETALCDP